uniref:Uncharacterized protein n=1 Tax=Picea glauca TaxID=3330 RepID=A0A124GNJ3_PICGL|nr:hypothetical protein ABT39_MTgene4350 [Picea glauca]
MFPTEDIGSQPCCFHMSLLIEPCSHRTIFIYIPKFPPYGREGTHRPNTAWIGHGASAGTGARNASLL